MKGRVRKLIDWCIRHLTNTSRILGNPYIASKYIPLQAKDSYSALVPSEDGDCLDLADEELPVPPQRLWLDWGPAVADYLASGRKDVDSMIAILEAGDAHPEAMSRVLDLGCGAGRMLRHFPRGGNDLELWGLDIDGDHIAWCQEHLGPPFLFATITTAPHLPFEDGYFDFVYCGSVFTHISDLADAWFLELRRVLRSRGYAYLTIHDKTSIDILLGPYKDRREHAYIIEQLQDLDRRTSILSKDFSYLSILVDPHVNVFYDAEYLVEKWSRLARFVSLTERAMDYQSALLFQKAEPR
jgi:SAM-dependent methyltransferase